MSSILIPVDFSLASHNAYRFGLRMARALKLDVVLAHYYSGAVDPQTLVHIGGNGTLYGSHLRNLRKFAYSSGEPGEYPLVEPPCDVHVTFEVEVRLVPSAAIIKRVRSSDISLVVMAPLSSDRLLGEWLGSTATAVSETCERPVYLVPPHARYRPFRRMVVANNQATADAYPLWQLEGLTEFYGSKVHFLHINVPGHGRAAHFVPWDLMEERVQRESGVRYPFEVVTVEDEDIVHGLTRYAGQIDADLIVIINQPRKRWQAALQQTLTQDLALRSRFPVLVLHTSPDKAVHKPAQLTEYAAS